jgi:hypothetical protein
MLTAFLIRSEREIGIAPTTFALDASWIMAA